MVPVPLDYTDGFNEAYYGRPEALLDPAARRSCSAWSFVTAAVHDRFTRDLGRDLSDGTWDDRYGYGPPSFLPGGQPSPWVMIPDLRPTVTGSM